MALSREEIHIISHHGKMEKEAIRSSMRRNVYARPDQWKKFVKLFLLTLGVGFTTSGILFFFAFNWDSLHKLIKIGLMETLVTLTVALVIFGKFSLPVKNTILMGAAILVGTLFAVYGQVYQTGANAYDFFLGWTLFISLWVFVSNFPALWLLLLVLINTTFLLYIDQVGLDLDAISVFLILFILTALPLVLLNVLFNVSIIPVLPVWFRRVVELASLFFITSAVISGIFEARPSSWYSALFIASCSFGAIFFYGFTVRIIFYPAIIFTSLIAILSCVIIEFSNEIELTLLLVSIFVMISVTLLIKFILFLQRKWTDG